MRSLFLAAGLAVALPGAGLAAPERVSPAESTMSNPIVEALAAQADLSVFVRLLKASGVAETLAEGGPYTIFAPTDAAFARQPAGSMEAWLAPENKAKLARLIASHIVAGTVRAQDIPAGSTRVPTLSGSTVIVVKKGNGISVGGAKLVSVDLRAGNATLHTLAALAMPEVQTN